MSKFETILSINNDGKLYIYNREQLIEWAKKQKPGRYILQVSNKRSNNQNRLWHKWIGMLAEYIGELDKKKIEKTLLRKVGWTEDFVDENTGETWKEVKGMSEASTKECSEIMEKVQIFVADYFHFNLPWPEEQIDMEM